MGDPNLEELRLKADELDISGMAADFGDIAARMEYQGVETADDLREFVERNPDTTGRLLENIRTLFGGRLD